MAKNNRKIFIPESLGKDIPEAAFETVKAVSDWADASTRCPYPGPLTTAEVKQKNLDYWQGYDDGKANRLPADNPQVVVSEFPQPDGTTKKFLGVDYGFTDVEPSREEVTAAALRRYEEEHPQELPTWFSGVDQTLDGLDRENIAQNEQIDILQGYVESLDSRIIALNERVDNVNIGVTAIGNNFQRQIDRLNESLDHVCGRLDCLESFHTEESLDRLSNHVNREIGVAQDVPLHVRLADLDANVESIDDEIHVTEAGGYPSINSQLETLQRAVGAERIINAQTVWTGTNSPYTFTNLIDPIQSRFDAAAREFTAKVKEILKEK